MSLTICGADYQGFTIDGINWVVEVSTAICLANGLTNYDVLITAVDESGASTQLAVGIPSPMVEDGSGWRHQPLETKTGPYHPSRCLRPSMLGTPSASATKA